MSGDDDYDDGGGDDCAPLQPRLLPPLRPYDVNGADDADGGAGGYGWPLFFIGCFFFYCFNIGALVLIEAMIIIIIV